MNEILPHSPKLYPPEMIIAPPIAEQPGSAPKFGRLILKDKRSFAFPLDDFFSENKPKDFNPNRKRRKWRARAQWDQGQTSLCTAHAFNHWFEMEPVAHPRSKGKYKGQPRPIIAMRELYCLAQQIDPWPGGCGSEANFDAYDGTSLLSVVKIAASKGYIKRYFWEFLDVEKVRYHLLHYGPVMVGTNWYTGMNKPNAFGIIGRTGAIVGGHAYLLDEWDDTRANAEVGVFNSWGPDWGIKGRAYMSKTSLAKLIAEDGEVCIAEEAE
jgi:hypothetical protein